MSTKAQRRTDRNVTADAWERRVQQLEAEGLTRSDAQAVADVEEAKTTGDD